MVIRQRFGAQQDRPFGAQGGCRRDQDLDFLEPDRTALAGVRVERRKRKSRRGDAEIALVKQALPLIQERIVKLDEVPAMLRFLFVKDFKVEESSLPKVTDSASKDVLKRSLAELKPLTTWNHESIEDALRTSLIEEMGLKPRIAFGAVRIATTGSTISPPLFESMELLGKDASLARIAAAIAL